MLGGMCLIARSGGAAKEVAPLLMEDRAEISGVIGVQADVANIPDPLGDDFFLMPHIGPRFPYPGGFIGRGTEVVLTNEHWLRVACSKARPWGAGFRDCGSTRQIYTGPLS